MGQTDKLPAHLACEDGCTFVVELDGYLDGSGTQGQTILLALFKPVQIPKHCQEGDGRKEKVYPSWRVT